MSKAKPQTEIRDRITELRRVKASSLLPNEKNWRKHPTSQSSAMSAVLKEIGYADALLARETPEGLKLIDGHLRRELTLDQTVPVLILDVTEAEADKILLTLDPLSAMAESDKTALDALLKEVSTGDEALTKMLAGLASENGLSYGAEPEAAPEPQIDKAAELQVKWGTELGQLWQIGRHRLLCGDSTAPQGVERVLGGAKPHLMVTDPPYGVEYEAEWRVETAHKQGQLAGERGKNMGLVASDERADWTDAYRLFPGDVAYLWHASARLEVAMNLVSAGFQIRSQIIWRKPNFVISRGHYHWQHEAAWYGVRKGHTSKWVGDRTQSTIWDIASLQPMGRSQNEADKATGHGTQKPLECMARPLRNHEGDVYDPFVGVGTTIVAAEQLNRTCYAIDIDPKWVAVTLERMQAMGLEPKLEPHA